MKGFRKPKKLTNKQIEKQERAKAFGDDYKAICAKHKLQLMPIIKHEQNGGSVPDIVLTDYEPPQLKSWADASEENLATQKTCKHINENGQNCKVCAVRIADQNPDGVGVTEEYIKVKTQKIADWRAKEKEEKPEPKV